MNGERRPVRTGRYVPFNLSSLAPFEATLGALAALPTLHSVSPTAALDTTSVLNNRRSPQDDVMNSMIEMIRETASQR